jgi:hypothetical protein
MEICTQQQRQGRCQLGLGLHGEDSTRRRALSHDSKNEENFQYREEGQHTRKMSQWNKTILEMSVLRGKHSFRSG